jgi:predicted ester cyclase
MNKDEVQAIVAPFYRQALTVNTETTSTAVLERILADGFQSINGQETKSKAALIKQVEFFWKLIPDLKWEPQDLVIGGNKVVVRSVASGSPKGSFMGLELDGSRAFKIDTTDIHEIEDGRIARVHHLEDWATAIKQLGPKRPAAEHCFELATFRLKPGVGDGELLAIEARVRAGKIASMPGYLSRELGKDAASGEWLMVMRFDTRAHMDAWFAALSSVPEMRELGALIEPGTMKTQFFDHKV